ncbi:MAG: peptidase domain-containing ABC transporter [Tenuifilaceae bacterium]|jgi:ATP-binding cassette subfamily B protein|nr:peptidase domain-containing ABC transporter [Tenuifilaceae bacterium]
MMRKGIKVKQRDMMDCGAACLASISAYYNLHLPVSKIRQLANTDKKGTNVLGLIEAAEKLGFLAKGVKGTYDSLQKIPKPAIAHLKLKSGLLHYVVILKATAKYVEIMDPGTGKVTKKDKETFLTEWSGVLVIMVPADAFEVKNERVSNFARLFYLLKPHKMVMTQALFGAIFFSIIGLSTSIYIQKLTDFVFVNGNKNLLNIMSVAMIALIIIQILLGIFQTVFTLKTGQLIDARLILGYYKHLLKLPQRFFDTMQTGEIISRIGDAVKIRAFINNTLISLIVNILIVAFSFGLMFIYSWQMALLVLIIIPIYVSLFFIANYINKKTERRIMEQGAKLESQLVESINTVGTIKRFGIEGYTNSKTEFKFVDLLNTSYTSGLNSVFTNFSTTFVSRLFTIIVLWVGSVFVLNNKLTPGELLSFYAILGYFSGPLNSLIGVNLSVQHALIASDRLFEIMDIDKEKENRIALTKEMIGDINFQNIAFRYGSRVQVFEDFNLSIQKGQITAIVGESGCGKSTLIHLLQNIYPIASGNIYIGGIDINQIENGSLRWMVGVVPQKVDLFKGSIVENICLGDIEPDMNKVVKISQDIGLTPLINSLPEGFFTDVGENGALLSGGQKQKIALARVLYRDPEIVILDEATSALDSNSEEQIFSAVYNLKNQGKTIIMIAHRLSTVQYANRVVVMEKGKVIESGSHDELYRANTRYRNMWMKQMPPLIYKYDNALTN